MADSPIEQRIQGHLVKVLDEDLDENQLQLLEKKVTLIRKLATPE